MQDFSEPMEQEDYSRKDLKRVFLHIRPESWQHVVDFLIEGDSISEITPGIRAVMIGDFQRLLDNKVGFLPDALDAYQTAKEYRAKYDEEG